MSRPRLHPSRAEKQRAYRKRLQGRSLESLPSPMKPPRRSSRPERLAAVVEELRDLSEGYRGWREALPVNLSSSQLAGELEEFAEKLDDLADEIADLDPPRGFGR